MAQAHVSEDDSDNEQTSNLLGNHTSEAYQTSLSSKTYVLYPLLLLAFSCGISFTAIVLGLGTARQTDCVQKLSIYCREYLSGAIQNH